MIVLIIAVLAIWFVVSTNIKKSIAYGKWNGTNFMMGRMRELITPEYIASKIGPASSLSELREPTVVPAMGGGWTGD